MTNVVAIIQARMQSKRLPGKVLEKISGKELLGRVIDRIKHCEKIDNIVVATGAIGDNGQIIEYCNKNNVDVYVGDEDNVLQRFYECAKIYNAEVIVRVTADDPFKDPKIIDFAIDFIVKNSHIEYVSNTLEPTYPEGLDIEVFRFSALEKACMEATLLSEKEHVTPYIWKNRNIFSIYNFRNKEDLSSLRLTIDYMEDLMLANKIFSFFSGKDCFYLEDILLFFENNPHLMKKNSIMRNEGYFKSCTND